MTQQQIVQEFKSYPKAQKSVVIRQLLRIFEADLEETAPNGDELSIEERKAIVESLAGSLKMENPPMTKKEIREDYYSKSANGNVDIPIFTIKALSLEPRTEFDFDNIAELIEQVEGDFYR